MAILTRDQAIAAIRRSILKLVDEDHSACEVAADKGILCGGFRQYTDVELHNRYEWLTKGKEGLSREELEELANKWQLARRVVNELPLCCDAQMKERDTCKGWDEFDNDTIARYYKELLGKEVTVT